LKVHLHHFSKIKSQKEVTKTVEIEVYFILFLLDDRRIRSRSVPLIRIRIQEAQKHTDRDPQHCFGQIYSDEISPDAVGTLEVIEKYYYTKQKIHGPVPTYSWKISLYYHCRQKQAKLSHLPPSITTVVRSTGLTHAAEVMENPVYSGYSSICYLSSKPGIYLQYHAVPSCSGSPVLPSERRRNPPRCFF
jgi:hypothetical protein